MVNGQAADTISHNISIQAASPKINRKFEKGCQCGRKEENRIKDYKYG